MNNTNILLVFLVLFSISSITIAQTNERQEYIYNNEIIKVELMTNKIHYSIQDNFKLKIIITNTSENDIYLFDRPVLKTIKGADGTWSKITINYNFDYHTDLETWQKMIVLSPSKKRKFNLEVSIDSLINLGYQYTTRINFGIGYIKDISIIKKNQHLSTIIPKFKKNSIVELSAVVAEAALSRISFESFGIYLEN